jgi:23S rRNA (pseudouridine1915-N3)-methyltransferase
MRLLFLCVGRSKPGLERDLATRYIVRAAAAGSAVGFSSVELREVAASRAGRPADRKRDEARALRNLLMDRAAVFAFDEAGARITSREFAAALANARDEGFASAAVVIGGPDGLDSAFLGSASLALSLGSMTWPHQLARVMAAEQIYRAFTILSGHPYHRD